MEKIKSFAKKEPVLCISALCALMSCFFVSPDRQYIGYIDFRTLALLYCLMVVVSGFTKAGLFSLMAESLCSKAGSSRKMALVLMGLCFFSSMLITNDVALLSFVPFTVAVLSRCDDRRVLIKLVVIETVAANMGSMLTPVGNPQNLYLYSRFDMSIGQLLSATAPVWLFSLAACCLLCLTVPDLPLSRMEGDVDELNKGTFAVSCALFLLCLAVVLRLMEWYILLPLLIAVLLIFDRALLRKADFLLLLTFLCFFIFVGNIGRIGPVRELLGSMLQGREMLTGALLSQVISNVPAAVLLSGFTENGRELLLGVDIGGLGTPIASLASLISLKLYSRSENARSGEYLACFSAVNFALLALTLAFAFLIN